MMNGDIKPVGMREQQQCDGICSTGDGERDGSSRIGEVTIRKQPLKKRGVLRTYCWFSMCLR